MKKVWEYISSFILVVVIVFTIFTVGVRFLHITPYAVLSGSMEPTYHVGALIYVKEIQPEKIEEGDPITFVLNNDLTIATHRVVEIDIKNRAFITKGDANDSVDGKPVLYENLIGKPVFHVPYIGYFVNWIQSKVGILISLVLVGLYIGISIIVGIVDKNKNIN